MEFKDKYVNSGCDIFTFTNGVQLYPMAMILPGADIGGNTRIQSFSIVEGGAIIGRDCTIHAHNIISGQVRIGNNVFVSSFVGFIDRRHPRNNHPEDPLEETYIQSDVVLGVNSTIFPVTVGKGSIIGAAAVVLKDVPPNTRVRGTWNQSS